MKFIFCLSIAALLAWFPNGAFPQKNPAEGFFTSEANAIATGTGVLVSIKKYNPTQSEIDNAARPPKNAPINYLMAPFEATNISMYGKEFESKLYSLDKGGKVLWEVTLGFSSKSVASPLKLYDDFIYAGEANKDAPRVTMRKIDKAGKTIWQTQLDSLHNVNDIFVEGDKVTVLVSFDVAKKLTHADGSYSEKVYPIYFFVQLDVKTGKLLKKEYQRMGNYLSSLNFSNPVLNTYFSYYLNNEDTAFFLDASKQESATVVSREMSKENSILKLSAGTESFHLLTSFSAGSGKKSYHLISNFYGKSKKYDVTLSIDPQQGDRSLVYLNSGDSVMVVTSNARNISIAFTDINGKTALYKKLDRVISRVVAAGQSGSKVFILQVEGRTRPGVAGTIRIDYY